MKPTSLIAPSLLVAATLVVMSGACSQYDPGPFEGGGRTAPTTVIGVVTGNGAPPEGGVTDTSIPDTFVLPETGGGGD